MTWLALIAAAGVAFWLWRDPRVRRLAAARDRWRPALGVLVLAALVGAVAAVVRGAWPVGLAMAGVALWAALFVRRETAAPVEPLKEPLSVTEARSLLGVGADADGPAIEEAYRRLMRRAHPDLGGTTGLAAQLNAAREVLLAERARS